MESGPSNGRKDPAWKYAHLLDPSNTNDFECNFCGKVTKGGVYRVKQHLIGGFRAAKACLKCPAFVRAEIKEYMTRKAGVKGNDEASRMLDFDGEDDNGEGEEEDDEVLINYISRSKRAAGSSKGLLPVVKKRKRKGVVDLYGNCGSEEVGESGKLRRIKQTAIYKAFKKALREKACRDIARWMYDAGIPFNAVNVKSFAVAVQSIARYGPGMKPPSYRDLRAPLLRKGVDRTRGLMKPQKRERVSEFQRPLRKLTNGLAPCLNDLAFVKYNQALGCRRFRHDRLGPVPPDDIDDSIEKLVEVVRPIRAVEPTHHIRSRIHVNVSSRGRSLMSPTRASKATRPRLINEVEASSEDSEKTDVEEEAIEGHKSNDREDDGLLDDNDAYKSF